MAAYSQAILTENGRRLISKVMSGEAENMRFTKICDSNEVVAFESLEQLTALSDIRQTCLINDIQRTNETSVKIEGVFDNTNLTESYHMRTLGLYALAPDEGEILYASSVETSGNSYIAPFNGIVSAVITVQFVIEAGNAEKVVLQIDPAALVTQRQLRELLERFEISSIPNETIDSIFDNVTEGG